MGETDRTEIHMNINSSLISGKGVQIILTASFCWVKEYTSLRITFGLTMFCAKFLFFACILVICEMQTILGAPTSVLGTAKISASTGTLNGYVCIKRSDLDALETLASTGEIMARRQRRMGPEVLFEVE
ncbi:hypothetical protein ACTXT7_000255 [Hymenolepis weldensis]